MPPLLGLELLEGGDGRREAVDILSRLGWNSLKVMLAVGRLLASSPGLRKVDGGAVVGLVDRGWSKGPLSNCSKVGGEGNNSKWMLSCESIS